MTNTVLIIVISTLTLIFLLIFFNRISDGRENDNDEEEEDETEDETEITEYYDGKYILIDMDQSWNMIFKQINKYESTHEISFIWSDTDLVLKRKEIKN